MFTEHVGNLQAAQSLEELKQVLEQVLGDCQAALTHDGSLRINGALPAGAKDGVLHVSNGYIAPNDADTAPDANGELPNGWGHIVDGGAWFMGQVRMDKVPVGDGIDGLAALPAGSVILWAGSIGAIPSGWALMDGTSNATGSGIDMRGYFPLQYISGDPTYGTIGATVTQALIFDVTGGTTTALTINNATTGITVTTPILDHSGTSTIDVTPTALSLTPSPTSLNLDAGSGSTYHVWEDTGASSEPSITPDPHDHSFTVDDVAQLFTDHPATACTITEPNTGAGHSHTGTVSINNIADALVDSAPSTLRPPGVVLAYIEKLP